jgi:hypothetical protein
MTIRAALLAFASVFAVHADTLILKDGTHVTGKWWSLDASKLHFLVNNQLQHYDRSQISAVTFGDATLPPPPAPAPTEQPPAAQPSPSKSTASQASGPPTLARAPESAPRQAPSLARPSERTPAQTPAPAAGRSVSEPEQIGAVYFRSGAREFIPLEKNQAVERKRGSNTYYEMPSAQSPIRVKSASELVFVVRLPKGIDPSSYSLFPLVVANGARRTESQPGRRGGIVTWPFAIEMIDETGYNTFAFKVKDLPGGEYSFSPSSSNDGYCFGLDGGQ